MRAPGRAWETGKAFCEKLIMMSNRLSPLRQEASVVEESHSHSLNKGA
jgi:hypothetical protein